MKKTSKRKKSKNILISILGAIIILFITLFIVSSLIIGNNVKEQCNFAKAKYKKDCVKSLSLLLSDKNNNYGLRNSAIWALGQLGDKNALPALKKHYTGNIPVRESLDKAISQYELKKAINLARGDINLTKFIWQYKESGNN